VSRIKAWLDQQGLVLDDVEITFYTDSMNDLPLLEIANLPVATNPDARLRSLAQSRGWRILDLF
jgi:phosphoserine phosphatase